MTGVRGTRRVVLAAALFAGGCDGGDEPPPIEPIPVPKLASTADKAPVEEPEHETIRLDNGFVPDPHVVEGAVVGSMDATTLADTCSGWIASEPDHLLETLGTFAELRVMAHSEDDATLIVETPDGTRWCADDDEGTDPVIARAFSPGTYRIWVGAPEPEVEMAYVLGLSELADVSAASLGN